MSAIALAEPAFPLCIEGAVGGADPEACYKEAASEGFKPVRRWLIGDACGAGELLDIVAAKLSIVCSVDWEDHGQVLIVPNGEDRNTESGVTAADIVLAQGC